MTTNNNQGNSYNLNDVLNANTNVKKATEKEEDKGGNEATKENNNGFGMLDKVTKANSKTKDYYNTTGKINYTTPSLLSKLNYTNLFDGNTKEEYSDKQDNEEIYAFKNSKLRYYVKIDAIATEDESLTTKPLNELLSIEGIEEKVFVIVTVVDAANQKKKLLGQQIKFTLKLFNIQFTTKSEHYCNACKIAISQKEVDYLQRLSEMPILDDFRDNQEWMKNFIKYHDGKLCQYCQAKEYLEGHYISAKKEDGVRTVSLKTLADTLEIKMSLYKNESAKQMFECQEKVGTGICGKAMYVEDYLLLKKDFPQIGDKLMCACCIKAKYKPSSNTVLKATSYSAVLEEVKDTIEETKKRVEERYAKKQASKEKYQKYLDEKYSKMNNK